MQQRIKSFVLRAGRISARQQQGLTIWLKDYQLAEPPTLWKLEQLFVRPAQVVIEIGFGMGDSLLTMAAVNQQLNYIGIEVHRAGIGSLAAALHERDINNLKIAPYDAVDVLQNCVEDDSIVGIQIFFPDPWPKLRHHKRRLISTDFIHMIANKLKIGGFIHCATDCYDYAKHIHKILSLEPLVQNQELNDNFTPRPPTRPLTKFEQKADKLGCNVWDLIFIRKSDELSYNITLDKIIQ